jgi:hypothetical protein
MGSFEITITFVSQVIFYNIFPDILAVGRPRPCVRTQPVQACRKWVPEHYYIQITLIYNILRRIIKILNYFSFFFFGSVYYFILYSYLGRVILRRIAVEILAINRLTYFRRITACRSGFVQAANIHPLFCTNRLKTVRSVRYYWFSKWKYTNDFVIIRWIVVMKLIKKINISILFYTLCL